MPPTPIVGTTAPDPTCQKWTRQRCCHLPVPGSISAGNTYMVKNAYKRCMPLPGSNKRIEVQQRGAVVRRTINLPLDLDRWLEERAQREHRSTSNMVLVILHDLRKSEKELDRSVQSS